MLLLNSVAAAQVGEINRVGGSVEVVTAVGLYTVKNTGSPTQDSDHAQVEEKVSLDLGGFALAPSVLTFDVGGTVGFRQNWLKNTGTDRERSRGRLLEYDVRTSLLPAKPVSVLFFANRFDSQAIRNFGTDTDAFGEVLGTSLVLGNRFFPSTLSWRRLRSKTEDRGGLVESRREEERQLVEYSGSHFSPERQIRVQLRDEDVDDHSLPSVADYHIRQADLSAGFRWGPYFEKSWRSSGRYFQRRSRNWDRGTKSEFQNFSANSNFRWDLTQYLSSRLSYDFSRFDSEEENEIDSELSRDQVTTSHNAIFSLEHKFYESIRSGLQTFANVGDQEGGDSLAYGGGVTLDYRKRLPWGSFLLADVALKYRVEDVDAPFLTSQEIIIASFTGSVLTKPLIDIGSIRVEVTDGGQPLVEGTDYNVFEDGDRTSIEIISKTQGGSVDEGERLTARYQYAANPDSETGTFSQRYGIGWDAGWMLIRYDYKQAKEELLDGRVTGDLQDSTRHNVRLELRKSIRTFRASLAAQLARDRTVRTTFNDYSLTQRLSWMPRKNLNVEARFSQIWREFLEPERRRTSTLQAGTSLSWRFAKNRSTRMFIDYRRHNNSETDDQDDLRLGTEARLKFGRIEVIPRLAWLWRERGSSELNDLRGTLQIRRRF